MLFLSSESIVTGNIIEYNHCDVMGGALTLAQSSSPTFTHNIFRGNTAGSMGGAVFLINSTARFKNNLFINNTADLNNSYSVGAGGGAIGLIPIGSFLSYCCPVCAPVPISGATPRWPCPRTPPTAPPPRSRAASWALVTGRAPGPHRTAPAEHPVPGRDQADPAPVPVYPRRSRTDPRQP